MQAGRRKHILVAVLDWGLGHATRSIPIIQSLIAHGCQVSIAGNGSSLTLLKQEFPQLRFHELPSYQVTYPSHRFFFWHLILQTPVILSAIRAEKKKIASLLSDHHLDAIISDNRYGCYSDKVPSVLITHQLNIPLPKALSWNRYAVDYFNHRLIKKFTTCWIPDFPSGFTGKLSETTWPVKFIGMLSRFRKDPVVNESDLVLGLVSGPEPQREIFEQLLKKEFKKLNKPCLIIRGLPDEVIKETTDGCVTLKSHAPAQELQSIIGQAGLIISRSGYTTIMDLWAMGKKHIIFIPTPGQTEQEYLAKELEKRKIAYTMVQDQFNLIEAMEMSKHYYGFDERAHHTNLLNETVQDLLEQI